MNQAIESKFIIKHQKQPNNWSCTQTCLAMLLNEPVEKVIEAFPSEGMGTKEIFEALNACRFQWNAFMFGTLVCDGFYMVAVPSLNIGAGGHSIILEISDGWFCGVYDPNQGIEGKRFYSKNPEKDGGCPVCWYSDVVYVCPGGRLPKPCKTIAHPLQGR